VSKACFLQGYLSPAVLRLIQAKPLSVAPVVFSFESLTTPDFSYRLFRSTAYTALP